ncbi:glycosyltransferase [Nostoc cycadae]|uniref:Glycosyltransferase n=1 Tax=Nostoc cycadae WK-1 TaxID=1861711 RepID=A0A2H6LMX4_9NOSO|nr:glycosyltransferase [Nostoc cycadae]GBE94557.1 glycosyltransferase [Nostoc cycadae WK-1]
MSTVKIGYLHIGHSQHGIRRYSELLASEARKCNLDVVEASVILTANPQQNRAILIDAAKKLACADVIHLQHNTLLWGERSQSRNIKTFIQNCSSPLIATFHDVYVQAQPLTWNNFFTYARARYGPYSLLLRWMFSQLKQILVCTKQESQRLKSIIGTNTTNAEKIKLVPHFVEERTVKNNSDEARKALQLEGFKIITLLGWIVPRKGHRLVIEALPNLPPNAKVIFAGSPSSGGEWFLEELLTLAQTLGVKDRLIITGYLSETELEQYLLTTDLAICPFQKSSASGSLSTWLSIAHPKILSFDLPLIDEYNTIEPGAIKTFSPYTPNAFAQAVQQMLSNFSEEENIAVKNIQQRLCMSTIFAEHLQIYSQIAEKTNKSNSNVLSIINN